VGCIAFSLFTTSAHAAWVPFNVAAAPGQQFSQQAISDGAGGTITVWIDTRNSAFDIYVQHLLASDAVDPSWPANGLPIGTLQDGAPTIASDGAGGAIVAWINTTAYNVVAQHVLANGTIDPAWPGGGVLVASGANQRIGVQEIPDGSGGVIIAWSDARNTGTTDRDIYAHRVRSTGIVDPAWTVNGVAVCTAANPQDRPAVVSDGAGGIIITWEDDRSGLGLDVYAQRISSTGTVVAGWTANGVALSTAANDQFGPMICSDGAAGAIVEWTDTRGGGEDVYAMRVRSTGALGSGWHANGEVISDASNNQELKSLIADGSGGAISSWIDFRVGDGTTDVYVQKITGASATSWTTDGAAVCTAPKNQTEPVLAPDGSGGAFLAWHDRRFETSPTQAELFLHHVLSTGAQDPAWPANGNRVTFDGLARVAQGHEPALVANGSGGATVVWDGSVDDLYALNLNATWTALYPLATSFTPEGAGVLSRNPDRLSYASGTIVTLTGHSQSWPYVRGLDRRCEWIDESSAAHDELGEERQRDLRRIRAQRGGLPWRQRYREQEPQSVALRPGHAGDPHGGSDRRVPVRQLVGRCDRVDQPRGEDDGERRGQRDGDLRAGAAFVRQLESRARRQSALGAVGIFHGLGSGASSNAGVRGARQHRLSERRVAVHVGFGVDADHPRRYRANSARSCGTHLRPSAGSLAGDPGKRARASDRCRGTVPRRDANLVGGLSGRRSATWNVRVLGRLRSDPRPRPSIRWKGYCPIHLQQ
jgi:hypothetical protein